MKTIFTKSNTLPVGILLLCLILTIACSKKNKDNPDPEPTCRIVTADGEGLLFHISYNQEGKISKVTVASVILP